MAKKARDFASLDELELSARTKTCLKEKYGTIDNIVIEGRICAYRHEISYIESAAETLREELEELLKRVDEIKHELKCIKNGSFLCSNPIDDPPGDDPIDTLKLDARDYHCLISAGIETVDDILNTSQDRWREIQYYCGIKTFKRIMEKMHAAGYDNFEIAFLKK